MEIFERVWTLKWTTDAIFLYSKLQYFQLFPGIKKLVIFHFAFHSWSISDWIVSLYWILLLCAGAMIICSLSFPEHLTSSPLIELGFCSFLFCSFLFMDFELSLWYWFCSFPLHHQLYIYIWDWHNRIFGALWINRRRSLICCTRCYYKGSS